MGLAEDQYSLSALMGVAGNAGDGTAVQAAFDTAWVMGLRTTYLCNTAMNNLARARRPDLVWRVRERMDTESLQVDRFTFSALIKAAGVDGDAAKLKETYAASCRSETGPDGYVYSDVFNAAAQCQAPDPAWLLQVCLPA
jgi:pentatricopeptide repeat protein